MAQHGEVSGIGGEDGLNACLVKGGSQHGVEDALPPEPMLPHPGEKGPHRERICPELIDFGRFPPELRPLQRGLHRQRGGKALRIGNDVHKLGQHLHRECKTVSSLPKCMQLLPGAS